MGAVALAVSRVAERCHPYWSGHYPENGTVAIAEQLACPGLYVEHAPMSMGRAVAIGATGFTLASLGGYSVWAFGGRTLYRSVGEAGLYAACGVVFIVL